MGNQIKLFPKDNVAVSAELDLETAGKIANTTLPLFLWGTSTYAQNQLIFGSAPSKLPFFIKNIGKSITFLFDSHEESYI